MSLSIPNSNNTVSQSSQIELVQQMGNMLLTTMHADQILQAERDEGDEKAQKLFSEMKNSYDLSVKEKEQLNTKIAHLESQNKQLKATHTAEINSLNSRINLNSHLQMELDSLKIQNQQLKSEITLKDQEIYKLNSILTPDVLITILARRMFSKHR